MDCGECTSARSQSHRCIQSKTTWLMFIHPNFVYKQKNFPKFQSFFFFKNTAKYDKLSKISNISIKTMLELRTKFGNFGNFGNFRHISDGLRKQYSVRTECCNVIGSEPLYIPCIDERKQEARIVCFFFKFTHTKQVTMLLYLIIFVGNMNDSLTKCQENISD